MSLGGYLFSGFKCVKPSGATNAQWALLIHQTRVKAFMEASNFAGAGWDFDEFTQEEIDDSVAGLNGHIHPAAGRQNVVFDITSDGSDLDLVSFFKKTNNNSTKYYMIASLFSYTTNSSYQNLLTLSSGSFEMGYYGGLNEVKIGGKHLFHAVSYDRFTLDCLISGVGTYPQRATSLSPITSWQRSSYASVGPTENSTYFNNATSGIYIGYALRDDNIISFISDRIVADVNLRLYSHTALIGFGGLSLSSSDDESNVYALCLHDNGSELYSSGWPSGYLPITTYQETLKNDSTRYPVYNLNSEVALSYPSKAFFNGTPTVYPYESVTLTTFGARTGSPSLNSDGITSKGTFNIELLATNGTYNYQTMQIWKSYAGGNYLCVAMNTVSSSTPLGPQACYYVGWDESNPVLTEESSWTLYGGEGE